jgi:Tfp pilus assembly protein PilX
MISFPTHVSYSESYTHKRGFVLLFAVLISSILLSIGLGMFSIAYKELLLSTTDRESQVAFYAADTGMECVLYWDLVHPATSTPYSVFGATYASSTELAVDSSVSTAECAGVIINEPVGSGGTWESTYDGSEIVTTFEIPDITTDGMCAYISVTKRHNSAESRRETEISSRGFNTCEPNAPRRAERELFITYTIPD